MKGERCDFEFLLSRVSRSWLWLYPNNEREVEMMVRKKKEKRKKKKTGICLIVIRISDHALLCS